MELSGDAVLHPVDDGVQVDHRFVITGRECNTCAGQFEACRDGQVGTAGAPHLWIAGLAGMVWRVAQRQPDRIDIQDVGDGIQLFRPWPAVAFRPVRDRLDRGRNAGPGRALIFQPGQAAKAIRRLAALPECGVQTVCKVGARIVADGLRRPGRHSHAPLYGLLAACFPTYRSVTVICNVPRLCCNAGLANETMYRAIRTDRISALIARRIIALSKQGTPDNPLSKRDFLPFDFG